MSTIILFITLIAIIAIFAVFFACYQSQQRARELQAAAAQEQASDARRAATIFSRPSYPPQGSPGPYSVPHRGHRKMPTPGSIISNLPCVSYDASSVGPGEKDEPPTCVICCCEYEQGDQVKLLPCMHSYHEECIDAWLKRDHCCPICQADVVLAAGLSLHDWSTHTCEAINWLSGAAARNRQHSDVHNETDQQSGSSGSVHQPATPIARPPVTPAAPAATTPASTPAATTVALQDSGDSILEAGPYGNRMAAQQQQQQQEQAQQFQPGQQRPQQMTMLPASNATNTNSNSISSPHWSADGLWGTFCSTQSTDTSSTHYYSAGAANPAAACTRPTEAAADATAGAANTVNTDRTAMSTLSAELGPRAVLAAQPTAAGSTLPLRHPHLVLAPGPGHVVVAIPGSSRACSPAEYER